MQAAAAERKGRRKDNREEKHRFPTVRVGVVRKEDTGDIGPVGGSPRRKTAASDWGFRRRLKCEIDSTRKNSDPGQIDPYQSSSHGNTHLLGLSPASR
ncbi:hypothetical protein B296_00008662 [Ensete ventricosum]|uniref:Uncharacterized protein n=1 Tax=Ensete ventricosum TaxID=4639 RepID=A0A426ZXC0_ENSVE|nr:hypothetical protein B296_00008662 [Ensete ventricosum]